MGHIVVGPQLSSYLWVQHILGDQAHQVVLDCQVHPDVKTTTDTFVIEIKAKTGVETIFFKIHNYYIKEKKRIKDN